MIQSNYSELLQSIRGSVSEGLERVHEIMTSIGTNAPGSLSKYIGELVNRRGKRMRATFVLLLSSFAKEDQTERGAMVSSSIELLHLATLVHDDIIDESDMRRNGLTAHRKWGTHTAVLVGDFALSKALELIINEQDRRIPSCISRSASLLCEGEMLEIDRAGQSDITLDKYFEIIYGKTASLWEACGECGGLVAGFEDDMVRNCAHLGKEMGMAFQIIDDVLDYGYGAGNLGKETQNDLSNGLVTLPLILFFNSSTPEEKQKVHQLLDAVNTHNDEKSLKEVTTILNEKGCFSEARNMALERLSSCERAVRKLPESSFTDKLAEFCNILGSRKA
ncbi:MAG: polyprenyl synthetase family protein [Fibrobacteria bacterium]|nr:polyprenyl synthetase family protein [Fibrobacteria bacterium]